MTTTVLDIDVTIHLHKIAEAEAEMQEAEGVDTKRVTRLYNRIRSLKHGLSVIRYAQANPNVLEIAVNQFPPAP